MGERVRWFEVPLLLLVLAVVAARSYIGDDLWFWDEATYLKRGVYPDIYGAPSWVESPAQSGMYGLWSQLASNPIDVYFLGNATSAVVFVAGVWFAARLLGSPTTAFLAGVIVAALPLTYIWPHLSGVPAGVLLASLALLHRSPHTLGRVVFLCAIWLASAFRPEFTWAATFVSFLFAAISVRHVFRHSDRVGPFTVLLVSVVLPALAALRFGNIWQRSDREWTAFAQHYSLRNPQGSADVWLNASNAAARDFPGAQSVTEALVAQPHLVLQHGVANALQTPLSIIGHALGVERAALSGLTLGTVGALFLLGITCVSILINRRVFLASVRSIHLSKFELVTVGIVAIFALAPMLVIYPRPHYQLIFVGGLIVFVSLILSKQLRFIPRVWTRITATGGVTLLLLLTTTQVIAAQSRNARFEESIRAVQAQVANPVIVSADREVDVFLPGSTVVEPMADGLSLSEQFNALGVTVVVITPILDQSGWASLPGYQQLLEDPTAFGFTEVIPNSNIWIR